MASKTDVLGGRYLLVSLLGHGGMSDVYRAIDQRSGTVVAVKVVRSNDPEFARRLAQETQVLERLEHRGLIRLLDTGHTGDQAYLVMELVDGSTLAESLRSGPLGPGRTALMGSRLADALAYVHEEGIVHRDVKPSNIFIAADGTALLGDFGIARLHDASTLTVTGTTLGTIAYMAPEQLEDHVVGPSADIWSLGIVLLECLAGRRVYEGLPSEIVARRLAGPVPIPADLPVPWRLLLTGMLDHRPDQRLDGAQVAALLVTSAFDSPWSASATDATAQFSPAAASDLTALVPGAVTTAAVVGQDTRIAPPAPTATSTAKDIRRWWLAPLATVALAALCIGLLAVWTNSTAQPHSSANSTNPTKTNRTTQPPGTTTPPSTATAIGSVALARLLSDIANGQTAGALAIDSGQTISKLAQLAVSSEAVGNPSQAVSYLQQASAAIATGLRSGSVGRVEGELLQSDLSMLMASLGLAVATTPPTIASTTTAPGSGRGKGHGHNG